MLLCIPPHGLGDVKMIRKTEVQLGVVEKEKWEVKSQLTSEGRNSGIWAKPGTVTQAGVGMVG
jgi:hypothetical protein